MFEATGAQIAEPGTGTDMYSFIKKCLLIALCFAASPIFPTTAYASLDAYNCLYETGTVFGENIDFSYDLKRNTILIRDHKNGGYDPNFTLGNVRQEGGMLQFDFEYWVNGTVAQRESHSLEFETMHLDSSQDFYTEDGGLAGHGQTAVAACEPDKTITETITETVTEPVITAENAATPSAHKQEPTPTSEITCHTKTIGGEGAKSGTWCVLSQLPSQKEFSYGPENLPQADGAWCEGNDGPGIGVGVEISFEPFSQDGPKPSFDRLLISNGYDKTTRTFMENSRVKKIEIKTDDELGGQSWVRTLKDETGVQEVLLGSKISPNGALITILDVYPGQKYDDTCLSFVMADFGF